MGDEHKGAIKNWHLAAVLATGILASCEDCSFVLFNSGVMQEGESTLGGWGRPDAKCVPHLQGKNGSEILRTLLDLTPHGSTNAALVIEDLIQRQRKVDVLVIVTDEQENHRAMAYTAWNRYRRSVYSPARLVVVNCSNTMWHLAPMADKSVTRIQTITPSIYQNLLGAQDDVVAVIERINLMASRDRAEWQNTQRALEVE